MLQFNNAAVADKYESLAETDREVHKAGVYSGLLSNITPEMADAMVTQQSNLIKAKEPVAEPVKAQAVSGQGAHADKASEKAGAAEGKAK